MKYTFNWFDLKLKARNEPESILILTYALTKSYNSIIAWNSTHLMNSLKIHRIPSDLFKRKLLIKANKGIIGSYKSKADDAYFKNNRFLFLDTPLKYKIQYIYLIGHRRMSNYNDYLNIEDFKSIDLDNPLIKLENNNIHFMYEGE